MNKNTPAILKTLIIYALIVPLAIWIGYLLAAPADRDTFSIGGILALILCAPLLLKWHHFLLISTWNLGLTIFFLPGSPPVWLLMTVLSLFLSVLHRTINSEARFLSAPSLTWPLIFFLGVVFMTAKLTGGIGLHSMGGEVSGGKHYITLIFGILGYFALTALRIPPQRVGLYLSYFFLMGCLSVISDLGSVLPQSLRFIFALFPQSLFATGGDAVKGGYGRFTGLGNMGMSLFLFMLARYGARGILLSGKPWRPVLFGLFGACIMLGGFRSQVILCGLIFAFQFFMERLHRTNVMPLFLFAGVAAAVLIVPFANKLPYTFQRSLAFLPLKINEEVRRDAEGSSDWRLQLWRDTYPEVPKYLLLGKGYALTANDLAMASNKSFGYLSVADEVSTTGNYHSGPLSVLMPFGAWGAIALLWFWIACLRALHANFRHGDPAFRIINGFLFAYYIAKILSFLIIFGAIEGDMSTFAVLIGLSVSINGGICRRAVAVKPVPHARVSPLARPQLQPAFPR